MKSSIRLFVAVLFFAVVTSLSSSAQARFSTVGGGGFWVPGYIDVLGWSDDVSTATIVINSNEVRVRQFILQSSFTIGHITTLLESGPYSPYLPVTFNFGIYDASGNLLLDSGAFNGASSMIGTVQTNSITSVTLCPGTYYYAQTASSSSVSPAGLGGNGYLPEVFTIANATTARFALAANSAASGALPSTLGALTAESISGAASIVGTGIAFFEP